MNSYGIDDDEAEFVATVRDFVDREVEPVAHGLEQADIYPERLIEQMKRIGIYGLAIPAPWGDGKVSTTCYSLVTEELSRGWMSLAGAMGGHTVVAKLLLDYGTAEQRDRYLPRLATGELRATMALTEPGGGSDLQALRTVARRDGDTYVVNGSKTWISNARRSGLVALLCKTDPAAVPAHRGISVLLAEPGPGFAVSRDLPKLGYKGVESCELAFDDFRVPADALLGGTEGRGFGQMMRGLEIGRIQVASRALGVGSTRIGSEVAAAAAQRVVPAVLELGGKSPQIVFADADLDIAAEFVTRAILQNARQTCSAGSRLLVEESVHDALVDKVIQRFARVTLGRGRDDPGLGPLISRKQQTRVATMVDGLTQGEILCGGAVPAGDHLSEGCYFPPTLIDGVDPAATIAQEEIFGPVLTVNTFTDDDQALALANGTEYALLAALWTRDLSRAHRLAAEVVAGQVYVNTYGAGGGVELPFGGFRKSGYGREKGLAALDAVTATKTVVVKLSRPHRFWSPLAPIGCLRRSEKHDAQQCQEMFR